MGVRRGIDRKKVGCRSLIDAYLEGQVGVNKFEQYDIIGLQETKTDSLDNVELKNFDLYFKHRRHISQRKSGGFCLAVKKHISNHLTIIDTDC